MRVSFSWYCGSFGSALPSHLSFWLLIRTSHRITSRTLADSDCRFTRPPAKHAVCSNLEAVRQQFEVFVACCCIHDLYIFTDALWQKVNQRHFAENPLERSEERNQVTRSAEHWPIGFAVFRTLLCIYPVPPIEMHYEPAPRTCLTCSEFVCNQG